MDIVRPLSRSAASFARYFATEMLRSSHWCPLLTERCALSASYGVPMSTFGVRARRVCEGSYSIQRRRRQPRQ